MSEERTNKNEESFDLHGPQGFAEFLNKLRNETADDENTEGREAFVNMLDGLLEGPSKEELQQREAEFEALIESVDLRSLKLRFAKRAESAAECARMSNQVADLIKTKGEEGEQSRRAVVKYEKNANREDDIAVLNNIAMAGCEAAIQLNSRLREIVRQLDGVAAAINGLKDN